MTPSHLPRPWLTAALFLLASTLATSSDAQAFCGMYVSGASTKLYNNATQVTLMRDGTKTVLSMRNNYQGPPQDFAMVVPVPVVLQKENVRILTDSVFAKIDALGAPRLVEYYEQNPCPQRMKRSNTFLSGGALGTGRGSSGRSAPSSIKSKVTVKARFKKGEYEIVVLSATESNALERWLLQNKYNIPKGSASVLKGYVQQGMYFFVAKVDVKKVKFAGGQANLSPLRFHYDSKDFSLPVRLGLLNANGAQDLIVNILAKNKRYEVANYKNTTIPTNLLVQSSVKRSFAEFYAALFDYTVKQNPGSVVTEYAWQSTKCDPCPAGNFGGRNVSGPLNYNDLQLLGMDVVNTQRKRYSTSIGESSRMLRGPAQEPAGFNTLRQIVYENAQRCRFEHFNAATNQYANVRVEIEVGERGDSFLVNVQDRSGRRNTGLKGCMQKRLEQTSSAFVKGLGASQAYALESNISISSSVQIENQWAATQGWVLTRLHTRYDKKTLKDDLVFKGAGAIIGGRGTPQGPQGALAEEGAKPSSSNNFQGRYVILNRWKGKAKCSNPSFGRWGYPPSGRRNLPIAAQDTAFVKRGKFRLKKAVRSKNVPGLKFTKKKG